MSDLRACVLAAADAIEAAREELGALDGVAGDGDHGMTMAIGARNIRQRLHNDPDAKGIAIAKLAALGMGSVGGAIGPIYATGLLQLASALSDAPADGRVTVPMIRAGAEAAVTGITALGKAKPGDKTILDALQPLVDSLRKSEANGDDLDRAIRAAARAARSGAESTSGMIATIGRASRLGERSRGHADPGAVSFAIVIEAIADAFVDTGSGGR